MPLEIPGAALGLFPDEGGSGKCTHCKKSYRFRKVIRLGKRAIHLCPHCGRRIKKKKRKK